jgi:hypothetical protein
MSHFIALLLGVIGSGISVYFALEGKRRRVNAQKQRQDEQEKRIQQLLEEGRAKEIDLDARAARIREFEAKVISYEELQGENTVLKRDLRNIDVNLRKLQLDQQRQQQIQESLDRKSNDLGSCYLKENVKWISSSLTPNNFGQRKERLQKVIQSCREIGFAISAGEESALLSDLKDEYEKVVRAAFEKEEQARIRAQIREEQKLEKEIERELKQLEREREAIQRALETALAEAKDEHSAEIEGLRARLAEAEEKSQRAMSRAQMTKSGHVYVISNVGSFGENVYKVGMTRRLEPLDRVKELGDASVPFPFDIHMMISSNDAPALENAIHRELHTLRVNKINPRKEFFRADIAAIHELVQKNHGEVEFVADAEALEYRQSLTMSEEDQEFIESVYDQLEDDGDSFVDDE